jgi:uncharacterized protein (TIGR03435 family)
MHANKRKYWMAMAVCCGLSAQTPKLQFEVATVRLADPDRDLNLGPSPTAGTPGSANPERIGFREFSLSSLIKRAYGVELDQISGPGWLSTERYDVAAKIPPGATKEQVNLMLQNLLVDRFKMSSHRVSKDLPVYELTVANGGPKLKETADPAAKREERPEPSPILAGATRVTYVATSVQLLIAEIRQALGVASGLGPSVLGRVADKTGLTGKYDFTLEFAGSRSSFGFAPNPDTASDPAPDIFEALEKQLGLKLVRSTAPQDILVIDHIEKVPTEN